jgi:succinoglycan biosynthesis transport protein ExoP
MFEGQDLRSSAASSVEQPALPLPGGTARPVHLLDRLAAVFKHRRLAGSVFVLVAGGMILQSNSQIPMYRTSARVMIQDERTVAVGNLNANDPMFWQESDQYYNTQYSILRSRGLAKRVVSRLQLQNHPQFNGSAPRQQGAAAAVASARQEITAEIRRLIRRETAVAAEAPARNENALEAALISQFLGGVVIVPERTTRLVEIAYVSPDPQLAAIAANTLAEEYTTQNLDQRLATIQKNLQWLNDEVAKQEKKVVDAEAALTQYRQDQNALSLGDRQNLVVAKLNALNETVTRQRTERIQKEGTYNRLKSVDPASDAADGFPAIATSPGVVEAKNRLTDLLAEQSKVVGRYLPNHPEMQKLNLQLKNAREMLLAQRARVIETVKNDYETAVAQERCFSASIEQQKSEAMDLDRKSGGYVNLQRQADSDRQIWQSLLQQQKELQVVSNSRSNNVQVMDHAEVPGAPFSPDTRRDWFTAVLAGVLAAFGLAFGVEYLDDTIKTPEDVSKRLNLALLGLVPALRGEGVPLLSETAPHAFGEAFRSLRTSLVFTTGGADARIIAVTSSQPLEGKTTTACNLATALALGGSRVLLIDADMRRPALHRILGLQNNIGLSHLLVGQARFREVVQPTTEPNLFVITAGRTPPNPSELLASERTERLLASLGTHRSSGHGRRRCRTKARFDWIVIDTPPVLAVTDPVVIAGLVSAVVFVIGSEMTRRAHAERALEMLRTAKPRSIAAVLNLVDFDRNKYYYSRYYGYNYKSYYAESRPAAARASGTHRRPHGPGAAPVMAAGSLRRPRRRDRDFLQRHLHSFRSRPEVSVRTARRSAQARFRASGHRPRHRRPGAAAAPCCGRRTVAA